jgi:transposase
MQKNISIDNLPDNTDALKQIVQEHAKLNEELKEKNERLKIMQEEVERLQEIIKLLQHHKFGKKSEQTDSNQLELFDEPETKTEDEVSITTKDVEVKSHKRTHNRSLPKNLPRKQIHYDLKDDEKTCSCGKTLHKFGEDKYEQLEYIPAKIQVLEHIKAKYSCKACETVKTAKMPKQPIPKSIATPGLLAQIITSKYADHLPLYRQEQIYSRIGIDLPRATFANWVFQCAELLKPLVEKLKQKIITSTYIQADETTVNVLSEKDNSTNYMWCFMSMPKENPSVVFEYNASRSGDVAGNFLKGFSGYLQTDAYSGYNSLKLQSNITGVGCFAHCRRKFFEITKITKNPGSAHIGLKFINKLYKIESDAKELKLNYEELYSYRQEQSVPILNEFKDWLDKTAPRASPKSAIGLAINYTLNQWKYLINYCLDGRLEIDNNAIERMIKPFALGRKNWMFAGNTKGACASAIIYSLVQTCKINNIEPYEYFRYALTEMPNITTSDVELENLLPSNFLKHNDNLN